MLIVSSIIISTFSICYSIAHFYLVYYLLEDKSRFYFGIGASSFSTLWFFGLALLASLLSRFLNNPKAMQIVSLISGLILILLALKLGWDVVGWIKIALVDS